jgi:hypothetical protein
MKDFSGIMSQMVSASSLAETISIDQYESDLYPILTKAFAIGFDDGVEIYKRSPLGRMSELIADIVCSVQKIEGKTMSPELIMDALGGENKCVK